MSNEAIALLQFEAQEGMHQRGPHNFEEQEAMTGLWSGTADERNNFVPIPPQPKLWDRFKRWIRA